ncbi:type II 3-dehydroquinate dehydratase [Streptomyces corynorhini]|uniref:3-dehydroquinate dehydratase n=1 Tax=Streptomyces corynorhini TaxID=2282652 RepID=A0A370BH64_9ACTN|nr:type II 3-dehydroquinate dehydratase [Streptomyces corynorhini]RDG39604.1 type II 3-dehydroquinate dehydratase [Streptomyces corynorhini]
MTDPSGSAQDRPVPVLVPNGPDLDLLGVREPEVYSEEPLAGIEALCRATAAEHGPRADFRQSDHEGVLTDAVQEARTAHRGILINPAGYGHTSVAPREAPAAADLPVVEVRLSDIHAREPFRHFSYVSAVAATVIRGAGAHGHARGPARPTRLTAVAR